MAFIEKNRNLTIRDISPKTEITNKAILTFFEDIAGMHSDIAGYGLANVEKSRISWVILDWKIKVLKRFKYTAESVNVVTWARGVVHACCFRDFELYNSKGELCAIGSSKWALINIEKGLMKITDDIMNKFESEEKSVFDNFQFKKLQEPENYSSVYNYTVSRRDIDINVHMHNLYYLDLAYDSLPRDVFEENSFDNVEIMYKKPAFLYDNLKCFYSQVENEHIVTIKSEDEKNLHAIIKLY